MDEEFYQIVDGLEINVSECVTDVTKLDTETILDLIEDLTSDLLDAHQAIRPTEQWARDKHSLRNALQVELSKRNLDGYFDE